MFSPLLVAINLLARVSGYSSGAPSSVCSSLTPGHGQQPLPLEEITYSLQVAKSELSSGEDVEVSLRGTGFLTMEPFMGFLLQVRKADTDTVVGTFQIEAGSGAKYLQCNGAQDSLTHQGSDEKTSVTALWRPGSDLTGQMYATATVLKDYSNYWVDFRSEKFTVKSKDAVSFGQSKPEPEPEVEPEPEAEPEAEAEPSTVKSSHKVYKGCSSSSHDCFASKSCFGLPAGCEQTATCDVIASWVQEGASTQVELYSKDGNGKYAALALSDDPRMGDDLVLFCSEAGGKVELGLGWNAGRSNQVLQPDSGMQLLEGSVEDGASLYCRLNRSNNIEGKAGSVVYKYQLAEQSYHLLVATGQFSSRLSYHGAGMALPSAEKIDMTRISFVGGRGDLFIKLHGALMVVAWLACAGSGMMLARYFKDTWRSSSCCGTAQWFQWHRLLMVMVWAATIAGVVLVAIELGGWPYDQSFIMENPHPVLGSAALILTFIQPLIAMIRPHPDSRSRWIFNWTHWFVGNSAHVIAIMAMFFAIELEKAKVERVVTWILVVYVIFHVFSHIVLSINICWAETPSATDVHPLSGRFGSVGDDLDVSKDKRGGSCRKVCFVSYFLVTWAIAAIILLLIFFDLKMLKMDTFDIQ